MEREASNQGERFAVGRRQHRSICGIHNAEFIHTIAEYSVQRFDVDFVVALEVLEPAEKAVAMPGHGDISNRSRQGGSRNMAYGVPQRSVVVAFIDHGPEVQARH
jgi:hypothetical protein